MNTDPTLIELATRGAERLMHGLTGAKAVVIATEDGLEIVARVREGEPAASRLAAMASSLTALGALAGEESQLGDCDSVTIEARGGHLVMVQTAHHGQALIVCVATDRDAVIGQALFMAKQLARALRQG